MSFLLRFLFLAFDTASPILCLSLCVALYVPYPRFLCSLKHFFLVVCFARLRFPCVYFSTKSMYKVYVCVPFLSFYEGNVRIVFFLLHMSMLLLRKKPIVLGSSMKMDGMTVTRVIMIDLRHNPQRIHHFFFCISRIDSSRCCISDFENEWEGQTLVIRQFFMGHM